MYITAKLPTMFGTFNAIKRENYPFSLVFTTYLETICSLGLTKNMDVDGLTGWIEDALLGEDRLPDIPEGDEPVLFRYRVENETIETYFGNSLFTNKNVVLFIIRMTLRLSEVFGRSLPRLTRLIAGLSEEALPEPKPVKRRLEEGPKLKTTKRERVQKEPDAIDRLAALVEKGDQMLSGMAEPENVVATNPYLNDFL